MILVNIILYLSIPFHLIFSCYLSYICYLNYYFSTIVIDHFKKYTKLISLSLDKHQVSIQYISDQLNPYIPKYISSHTFQHQDQTYFYQVSQYSIDQWKYENQHQQYDLAIVEINDYQPDQWNLILTQLRTRFSYVCILMPCLKNQIYTLLDLHTETSKYQSSFDSRPLEKYGFKLLEKKDLRGLFNKITPYTFYFLV